MSKIESGDTTFHEPLYLSKTMKNCGWSMPSGQLLTNTRFFDLDIEEIGTIMCWQIR